MNHTFQSVIRTPLTDLAPIFDLPRQEVSKDAVCRKIAMEYANCAEAYGLDKSKEKCADLFQDIIECSLKAKQFARLQIMHQQREKLAKEGKLPYSDPPALDMTYPFS